MYRFPSPAIPSVLTEAQFRSLYSVADDVPPWLRPGNWATQALILLYADCVQKGLPKPAYQIGGYVASHIPNSPPKCKVSCFVLENLYQGPVEGYVFVTVEEYEVLKKDWDNWRARNETAK